MAQATQESVISKLSPREEKEDFATRARLSEIDASMKWPAIFFMLSGVLWLQAGTVFAIMAAIKATNPFFLGDYEWLTFGRVRSAHLNAMIFGWGNNAIFAVGTWIMARLCRTKIRHQWILVTGGTFWNIAITIGIIGILAGDITSVEWLEMPPYVTPLVAVAYALVGVWTILAFRWRQSGHIYVSQWYLLAAFFWLPWLYTIAQMMIIFEPAQGVVQAITNWWFAHNVLGLWLTPVGLAAAYYFIPKVLGVPIHSYYLSLVGFWSLALFYNWAGMHHLIGGPVPAWVVSAGTVASVMMTVPVIVTAINHHMTVVGRFKQVWVSPTLRFIVFGAVNYTMVSLAGSGMALRNINEVTHFTHLTVGHAHHGVYAFFTMIMFGSIYFIMPRIFKREWPSALLIKAHFWCTAIGITIMLVALHVGGWLQGVQMNDADAFPAFTDVVRNTIPFLHARSISGVLLAVGHLAFGINFFWMIFAPHLKVQRVKGPTLFTSPEVTQAR